ncbi:CHAT domain-containing protein [Solihabitans fulvus]|uniref:CHAT domain-containing protein n=1 Tax=Solihabitans fulvus TaxID=1892852 RepID=A0A5B2XFA0_9PSEU|nr:CHAT domain-containing protein [Solihabitans fulvus]KAA2261590.1 CHAT domain-containing protein [Solihabitans fulvus]
MVTPVVQVRLADAGDLFLTWRWTSGASGYGSGQVPGAELAETTGLLASALPGHGAEGMRRAFLDSALCGYAGESDLAAALAETLWPVQLTEQLRAVAAETGTRPTVRIQPSPRVAQVPWELLAVDADTRLVELADLATSVPISLRRGTSAAPQATDRVVLVLDPRVPGTRPGGALGSVLGQADADPGLLAMVRRHVDAGRVEPGQATGRADLDRDWLGAALRGGARRLLYVGHVSSAPVDGGQSEDAQLHLCCGPDTIGFADVTRGHRPLSAKDLLLGTLSARADGVAGAELWPAPERVALIACESGGDLRFAESFGLGSAMIHNGAALVTATRWPVPTSHAFQRLTGLAESVRPLTELIVAVDHAHEGPDPVRQLGDWQRAQLARWRDGGRIEHSPLLWGALTTLVA